MAFRFLINVDKCLNMYNFDFFFYQKKSLGELHLTPDVYIGEGTGLPFGKAASDIRLYLDRSAYIISDYQIIIAMRWDYKKDPDTWEETLLARLLNIDFELRKANIKIRSGFGHQIAVNMIMLYEATVIRDIHAIDEPYMGSQRLLNDFSMLLREIGIPDEKEYDLNAIKTAWNTYVDEHSSLFDKSPRMKDGTPAHYLYAFFTDLIRQYEKDEADNTSVSAFYEIKKLLEHYQIFEILTDKQNLNKDINTLFKIVEFVNADFEIPVGMGRSISLNELCATHWRKIVQMNDMDIQRKYAKMLHEYKERLSIYAKTNKDGYLVTDTESKLPDTIVPSENDIGEGGNAFENDNSSGLVDSNPEVLIDRFGHSLYRVNELSARWDGTQKELSDIYGELEKKLSDYSDTLGKKYAVILEERKEEEKYWHSKAFIEDENTGKEINDLAEQKKNLLKELEKPQMTPSLRFQDQLNVETALEQENQNIRHYIECMEAVSARSFVLLIILLTGMVTLLFGLLQSYDFETGQTALYFFMYIAVSFVLMMLTWTMPVRYYRKKIQICLKNLKEETKKYIDGYFDRAQQLREYVNLINRIDYIERHLELKKRAVKTTDWVVEARNWHLSQVKLHLQKLEFFDGLINTYVPESELSSSAGLFIEDGSGISKDHMSDVTDNILFWPQREGSLS